MAGRILPIALATISGVAIGLATFGEEFKKQQQQRLQDEYKRYDFVKDDCICANYISDLAAVSSLNSEGPSPMASSAIKAPHPEQIEAQKESTQSNKASSFFGFGAWSSKESASSSSKD